MGPSQEVSVMSSKQWTVALVASLAVTGVVPTGRLAADEMHGVISGIDLAKNELLVDGRGNARGTTMRFVLNGKTLVLFNSEKGSAKDLASGRRVRVEYEQVRDGERTARVIRALGRPAAAARAVETRPPAPGPFRGVAQGDAITGVLQRVARADRELVVIGPGAKGPDTETTVAVPEDVKIVKDGKPVGLEALKEGDAVSVRAEQKAGRLTAREVVVGQGAPLTSTTDPVTERGRMVPRIRQVLHIADEMLRRFDPDEPDRASPKKP
jgi:cold shock CspA family protein